MKGAVLTLCEGLNPPTVALALAGLLVLFAGLYLLGDVIGGSVRQRVQFGTGYALPGLVAGILLLTVSGLTILNGRARRSSSRIDSRAATAFAIVAAIAAVDAAAGVHARLWEDSGTQAELVLPSLLVGAGLVLLGGWLVRRDGSARSIWFAGGLVWAASIALGLGGYHGRYLAAVIDLIAASLFALALLVAVRATTATRRTLPSGAAIKNAALHALHSVRVEGLAAALGCVIVVLCIAGVLLGHRLDVAAFDLSKEQTIPALFTGAVLMVTAGLALAARTTGSRLTWLAIAGVLALMGGDELFRFHERLRGLGSGDASWLLLLPYAGLVAYVWLVAWRQLSRDRRAGALWLGGVAVWVLSQALDGVDFIVGKADVDEALPWNWVAQEGFEMAGSVLFLLALIVFLQRAFDRPAPEGVTVAPYDRAGAEPQGAR